MSKESREIEKLNPDEEVGKKRKIVFWSMIATGIGVIVVIVLLLIFLLPKDEKFDIDLGSNVSVEDGTLTGNGSYKKGDSVTIVAEDIDGYRFTGWSYGGSIISTDKEYTFEISEETEGEYTANYAKIYSISTFDNNQYGSFIVAPTEAIAGETVTVSYEVNSENQEKHQLKRLYYVTAGQSEQITIENNRFTMPEGNVTIYAEFNNLYNINLTTNISEEVDLTGQGTYIENESVTISAPNVDGYRFRNWTHNEQIVTLDQEYIITKIDSTTSGTYMANYDVLYQISTSSPNGVVTIVDSKDEAIAGESVEFTITPNENYRLIEVKLNDQPLQEQNSKYTFEMPEENVTIIVTYIQQLEVTLESNIELADSSTLYGGGKYDINSSVELYAPVNTVDEEGNNYRLIGFKYNDSVDLIESIDEGIYTFTLTEQTAGRYTAVYEREYQITVDENSTSNIVLTQTMGIQGDSITFTATITDIVGEDNILIRRLKIQSNGQEIEYTNQDNQYTFIMPAGDVEISLEVSETLNIIKDFEISGNTITKYTGSSSEVVVPESYQTYTTEDGSTILCEGEETAITVIGDVAFATNYIITKIILPSTLQSIGYRAFYSCYSLALVINNSDLTITKGSYNNGEIGIYAKEVVNKSQPVGRVETKENVQYYINDTTGEYIALRIVDKNVTSVVIQEGTKEINQYAFSNCSSLTEIVIPERVTEIGSSAFFGCYALAIVINNSNLTITERSTGNGFVGNYAKEVVSNAQDIVGRIETKENVQYYINDKTREYIALAPANRNVTSVVIQEGTKEINQYAFRNCSSLTEIVIPESVTTIGSSAFSGCNSLALVINNSDLTITKGSYDNGEVGYNAIEIVNKSQPVGRIETKENVQYYINDTTGEYIALKIVDENVTSVVIQEGTKEINQYAFSYCSNLTEITLPSTLQTIGGSAFERCISLTKIVIPEGVKIIDNSAFFCCSNLAKVTLPSTLQSIGDYAFSGCTSLTNVTIESEDIYKVATSPVGLLQYATTVRVPTTIVNTCDNSYLENVANYTTSVDGEYTVFTKVN